MAKILDPILPVLSILGHWSIILGSLEVRGTLNSLQHALGKVRSNEVLKTSVQPHRSRPLNVPLLRALWSLLDGIWGSLKGSWGSAGDWRSIS